MLKRARDAASSADSKPGKSTSDSANPDSESPEAKASPPNNSRSPSLLSGAADFFDAIEWLFAHFGKTKSYTTSDIRALEEPFEQLPGFRLVKGTFSDEEIEQQLDTIVKKIFLHDLSKANYLNSVSLSDPEINPQVLKDGLRSILFEVRKFNSEYANATKQIDGRSEKIWKELKPILVRKTKASDPVASLGKALSEYKIKNLKNDRKTVMGFLHHGNREYLANILGILGPKNIFSPEIKLILKQGVESKKLNMNANLDNFVQELSQLQEKLSEIAAWDRTDKLALHEHRERPAFTHQLLVNVEAHEKKLIDMAGTKDNLLNVLAKIQESDIYRSFQRDLEAPNSVAAYELQLIEPWGLNHNLKKIALKDLPSPGVSQTLEHWEKLEIQAPLALENSKARLEMTSKTRLVESKLGKYLSPKGIKYVSKQLEKGSKTEAAKPPST